MLHLLPDCHGTAIGPFTPQPSPDEETNLRLVEDLNLAVNGSTWAVFAAGLEQHPTTEGKLCPCSAPGAAPAHRGEGVGLSCRCLLEDTVLSLLLHPSKAAS